MDKKYFDEFTRITEAAGDALMLVNDGNGVKGIKVKDLKLSLDNIFATGAGAHNGIYRGKNLGTSVTADQWAEIAAGTFKDLYIGDYWVINGKTWRIAGFDYWLHCGDTECTSHHVVIVPDENLKEADGSTTHYMNTSNITTGGYVGTGFYSGTNADSSSNTAKADCKNMAKAAFGAAHLLSHRVRLTNAVTDGKASNWSWYDSDVEMMNEAMVYGHSVWADSGYEVGVEKGQLPLFALDHSKICNRASWWLRDVVSAAYFADVGGCGDASYAGASNANIGVRPAFAIF